MIRILTILAATCLLPLTAAAQTITNIPEPVIVTSGEAEVKRPPDRAWVEIRAESRARDPKEAQRLNVAAMTGVMEKIKALSLGADAVRTLSYDLQPEFDYANGRQTLRGYVARNSVEVRVDDITRVGDVLGGVVGSGATSVGGLRFDLKNREAAEREALRLAVQDARARAEALAAGAGVKIDRIVRIEESRVALPPRPMMQMREMASVAADAGPPITPGTVDIKVQVTLTASVR